MKLHFPLDPATGLENQALLPWTDGVPATGVEGSYPPFEAVVYPMMELVNLITGAGLTPDDGDLTQVLKAVKALAKIYKAAQNGGLVIDGSGNVALGFDNLPVETSFNDADKLAGYTEESENGLVLGTPFAFTIGSLVSSILGRIPAAPNPDKTLWHEGSITGSASAWKTTLSPAPTADASGINMRLLAGQFVSGANPTLDFGFGPKPVVYNRTDNPLVGGEMQADLAFFGDFYYDGVRVRMLNPIPPAAGALFGAQVFTASGTYVPSKGANSALTFSTGGGGAGGNSNGGNAQTGLGGGAGGTAIALVSLTGIASVPVTIGAGGAPTSANAPSGSFGGAGGTTSFGNFAIAGGGKPGAGSVISGPGGAGGQVTAGLIQSNGNPGEGASGNALGERGGTGGASFWGGAGFGQDGDNYAGSAPAAGGPGSAPGAGGGGGDTGSNGSAVPGGAGAAGVVLILEFQ